MKQTPEQQLAGDPSRSVWVGASAGTGKTFVLTSRVLRLMLGGTPPERILCLTFTKAAAAEMANRINGRLGVWALCPEDELRRELTGLTGAAPTADDMTLARQLFVRVLDVPGGLKIQTIHSFCQSLLGRFPLEARLAPHFQVIDERTANDYQRQALDEVLTNIQTNTAPLLEEALAQITQQVSEFSFHGLVAELSAKRGHLDRLFARFKTPGAAEQLLRRAFDFSPEDSRISLCTSACEEGRFNAVGLRQAVKAIEEVGTAAQQKKAAVMAHWLSTPEERLDSLQTYSDVFLTKAGEVRSKLVTKKVAAASPQGSEAMEAEAIRLQHLHRQLKAVDIVLNTRALLQFGQALMAAYQDSKQRHATLDYSDLILSVMGLLSTPDVADWILYKLDGGIDHILIDEAQDTNPEQWKIIKTLGNEFFTGESARSENRTIFAVGDVKQSIYSFQGAEPKQFAESADHFQQRAQNSGAQFSDVQLDLSFRSTSAVLDLVDAVFAPSEMRVGLTFGDEEIHHTPFRVGQAGQVELWPLEKRIATEIPAEWHPPVIQDAVASPETRLAHRIADVIAEWLHKGEILESQGRPITPSDIMVLVRHRTAFEASLVRALKDRNVPVAGRDRMMLTDQLAVMDMMAAGNFALLPDDDLTCAVMLKTPFVGLNEDDLFELAYDRGQGVTLWQKLLSRTGPDADEVDRRRFGAARDVMTAIADRADFSPPFEFYAYLLTAMGGRAQLISRLGEEANDPVDEFLNLTLAYEQNNVPSLQGFLRWISSGEAEVKRDMEQTQDQVRIMTVHGAKGLQAPVVFMPDCCQIPTLRQQLSWMNVEQGHQEPTPLMAWPARRENIVGVVAEAREAQKQLTAEEYRRLLYVALTRAEDRLYVCGWDTARSSQEQSWYEMIRTGMAALPGVQEIQDDDERVILRYHNDQTADVPEPRQSPRDSIIDLPLPHWAEKHPVTEPEPPRPLRPSQLDEEPSVTSPLRAGQRVQEDRKRFQRGRLLHHLLERLPDLPVAQQANAAADYLRHPMHDLSAEEVTQYTQEVMDVLQHKEFSNLFGPGSQAEVPLVGLMGTRPISGQVDRLVVTATEVLVVDYKTNRPPPQAVEKTPRAYVRQMAAYRYLLQEMYPEHTIYCALLWTEEARLMVLPSTLMDDAI